MDGYHFEVLTKGGLLTFNGECDTVNYESDKACVFKKTVDNWKEIVLAIIPYDSIIHIVSVEDKEEICNE